MADKKIDKYAVIRTGGKQYLVHEGEYLSVEKLDIEEGEKLEITDVLLFIDGDKVVVGQPVVAGVKVTVIINEQYRDAKKIVFKAVLRLLEILVLISIK